MFRAEQQVTLTTQIQHRDCNLVHSAVGQHIYIYIPSPRPPASFMGDAGDELGKDNRVLTLEAADHLGRNAEDVSTCRRSKIQPQLTLSRNSSTDEAQLESGISPESRS